MFILETIILKIKVMMISWKYSTRIKHKRHGGKAIYYDHFLFDISSRMRLSIIYSKSFEKTRGTPWEFALHTWKGLRKTIDAKGSDSILIASDAILEGDSVLEWFVLSEGERYHINKRKVNEIVLELLLLMKPKNRKNAEETW